MRRLADIRDHVLGLCLDRAEPVVVVVEGYAMGTGRQAGTYSVGELGGVVRLALHEAEVPYVDVAPATLKKFGAGKGNANKSAMGLAAARCGYDGPGDDNAIDAWWLRELGVYANTDEAHRRFGYAYRDEAVAKIDWPSLVVGS